MKVKVKWNKQLFEDVEIDFSQPPSVFKAQLYSLTSVEPGRQKVMVKGGTLKDDADWSALGLKEGQTLMMMGTPGEINVDEKPKDIKFIEDMTEAEIAETIDVSVGLENLGNTCYANSTIQCLKAVPELTESLNRVTGSFQQSADGNQHLAVATRDLFKQMSSSTSAVTPYAFILLLRRIFPQFDQVQEGRHMQQDAEECWAQVVSALGNSLKTKDNQPFISNYFNIELLAKWTCDEDPEEPPNFTSETMNKLQCHISNEVNYLHQGLKEGLTEKVEKRSERLGRTAVYTKDAKINLLPSYLTINFVRFFWRKDTQKKAKILRKVKFPLELDLFEFCTDQLKEKLQPARALINEYQEKQKTLPKKEKAKDGSKDQEMKDANAFEPLTGENKSGIYELIAVLTHIGRSSDSGHYIGWTKKGEDEWLKFDDEKVSLVRDEDIMKLDGGGDWHTAYLLLYREKPTPKSAGSS